MADESKAGGEMPPEKPGASAAADKCACSKCGDDMPGEARYCAKCGTKNKAMDPDDDEDDAPESSKPGARLPSAGATVASMLGLRADASDLAVKTALASLLNERDHVRKALGASDAHGVKGKLQAMAEDVREGVKAKQDLVKVRAASEKRERKDLLLALVGASLPGLTRGELIRDVIATVDGKDVAIDIEPNPDHPIANAPIKQLRAYAASKLANVSAKNESPFAPGEDDARTRADRLSATAAVTDKDREAAQRTGRTPEDVAASRRAMFPTTSGAPRATTGG